MPRREMSKEEYDEQQFGYRYNIMDPQSLQKLVDSIVFKDDSDYERGWKIKELQEKLIALMHQKIECCLTKRQQDVIHLYLLSKKQDYIGQILGITQEAVHSRLTIAFSRLRKFCEKDPEIKKILNDIQNI